MSTILITGINGFLGSNLAKLLVTDYAVVGLETNKENNSRIHELGLRVYDSSARSVSDLFRNEKPEIVIHTATLYGRQNETLSSLLRSNLLEPLELCRKAIENHSRLFINTDTVLDRFSGAYAMSKNHFREWLYLQQQEIKIINLQLEHFYGPGAGMTNFITMMTDRLRKNEPEISLTLGEQERNFIYIEDVCSAFRTVVENRTQITGNYTDFQVATDELVSIRALMTLLKELTSSRSRLNFGAIPYRENELMRSVTDNSALRQLGWQPEFTIREGIQKTLNNLSS